MPESRNAPLKEDGPTPAPIDPVTCYEKHLRSYEEWLGAETRSRRPIRRLSGNRSETIVISDLHYPDVRMDFIQRICGEHAGCRLVIAGDINDMEAFGRWDVKTWGLPSLKDLLAGTDALLEHLTRYFPEIYLMMGNHDLRLPRKAGKVAGPDFYWLTQEFLLHAYQQRHGIHLCHRVGKKENGRDVPSLFYTHQIGDCVISHVETAGKPVGRGAERAHDVLIGLQEPLGLEPFRVLLHAHTHKQAYFRHPLTGIHLYELGCLCDVPTYHFHDPKYGPIRHGYYRLVQYNDITSLNESRLVCLDEP